MALLMHPVKHWHVPFVDIVFTDVIMKIKSTQSNCQKEAERQRLL